MAKMRRRQAADEGGFSFDWQPLDDDRKGSRAFLENGDLMEVSLHVPHINPREIWEYTLMGPAMSHADLYRTPPGNARMSPSRGGPGTGHPILGQGAGVNGFNSHDEARRAAEEHYKSLNRKGMATSSGFDYDKFFDQDKSAPLDDDFGDIFGDKS